MVASSEQHNAPVIVSKPATVHASSNHPGAPLKREVSAEVIKIPDPIIDPMTIMVASMGPSVRTRPLVGEAVGFPGPLTASPTEDCSSLISSDSVRKRSRPLSPIANARYARTRPRLDYRREDKPSPRGH